MRGVIVCGEKQINVLVKSPIPLISISGFYPIEGLQSMITNYAAVSRMIA